MKSKGLFLAAILTAVLCFSGNLLAYSGGTGEPNNPYQIANKADLLALTADTNDYDKCFILTTDINMAGQVFTKAIIAPTDSGIPFFDGTAFTGIFDGKGHKVTNLTINGNVTIECFIGLFGYIGTNGSVKNLGIENCVMSGYEQVGGLCGRKQGGNITNCYSTGTVTGHDRIGGLCGVNENGSMTNCYSTCLVSGISSPWGIGGLAGYSGGGISSCYFLITNGPDNGLGTPLTDEQMKQQSSFVGWDFVGETANGTADIWKMVSSGIDYPRLAWERSNIAADLNGDWVVDWSDLEILISHWLETTDSNSGMWTWVSGPNMPDQDGVYGTKGVADPNNKPGGRDGSVSWKDSSGNLWLFGGWSKHGLLNDLWKYNQSSGFWTWVSGSNAVEQLGVYGTKGVAGPNNVPGARANGVSWIDANGNFWLFGGDGYDASGYEGELNDLWKYNPSSGFWTWVSGSNLTDQIGVYGTIGVAVPDNMPGGRDSSVSWIDSSGNLWLFGGWGVTGYLNDLWKYNQSSGFWTWVSGSNVVQQPGIYGTKGVAGPNNVPGARGNSVSWKIDANGNFWLFGGYGYDANGNDGELNDLWKYNLSSGFWTWVSGSNLTGQSGVYGTNGVAAPDNMPGGRDSSVSWIDGSGNLWLFGGYGCDANRSWGYLNDLWKFDGTNWTWGSGSNIVNQQGIYGTKGMADPDNVPGARGYSVSWIDGSGNFWLFGGWGFGISGDVELGDLWKFNRSNPTGDLNGDGIVNFGDFAILILHWTPVPPIGDFTGDFKVDFSDLYYLTTFWLSSCSAPDWCDGTDLDQSGLVDFVDFAIFAQHWCAGVTP